MPEAVNLAAIAARKPLFPSQPMGYMGLSTEPRVLLTVAERDALCSRQEVLEREAAALRCDATTDGRHEWRANEFTGMHDGWCCRCGRKAQDLVDAFIINALKLEEAPCPKP